MMFRKHLAFLKKELLIESSYKLAFIFNIFSVLTSVLVYFFIDKLFGQRISGHLEEFGTNYFSYVLLGMAFFSYIGSGLGSFSGRIQSEQIHGTLEAVLVTPIKISTILFSMALWNMIFATLDLTIYLSLGIFLFKVPFSNINAWSALITLALTITSFSALGILSASFTLIFKRGNPMSWVINNLEGLIGGVYFPITVMPYWLQFLAKLFPITYSIRAIELAVYKGFSLIQLKNEITYLALFSLLLVPLSLATFKYALKKARWQGTLGQY